MDSVKKAASPLRITLVLVLVSITITACISRSNTSSVIPLLQLTSAFYTPQTNIDIEAMIDTMSVRTKVAQLMHVWAYGEYQTEGSARFQRIRKMVEEDKIGGVIFSRGDVYGQAVLTNKLQSVSEIPLWISQDMEVGAAMRISGTTRFPPSMAIAATGNTHYEYEKGRITALEARILGVHQIYAPVVDVNNNPANPVINVRSYSEDPAVVSLFADAFIRGAQEANVVATAKHFPGHGDTFEDSHYTLPVITHNWARLDSVELAPFRAAIRSGVKSIMSAHIAFPHIGDDPNRPGTLDPLILGAILRDSLKFDGIITTDALEMDGVANYYAPGEAVVLSINAGADMLLIPPDITTALDEAERAVLDGRISEERLNESVRRILKLKVEYGLFDRKTVDVEALYTKINTIEHQLIADEMSRESITILKNANNIVPIRSVRYPKITVIALAQDRTGNTGSALARAVRQYHPDVTFHVVDQRSSPQEINRIIESTSGASLVILGLYIDMAAGANPKLPTHQTNFLNRLKALNKPTIAAALGNPYAISLAKDANVHVLSWASTVQQTESSVHALFGASDVNATLPISIPGMYKSGDGLRILKSTLRNDAPEVVGLHRDSLRRIDSIIENAIRRETFPGATVAVLRDGVVAYSKAYGYHDYSKRERTREGDVFDLASITKVMGTTLGMMKLVDEGKVSLEDPISKYFSEFANGDKAKIKIHHFLTHTSGLPAFRVYVDEIKTRNGLVNAILNEPLINTPGETYVYSDLGMIILALIIEKVAGVSFDNYMSRTFYGPLGMTFTTFRPNRRGAWYTDRILPTENDTIYRKTIVRGVVHDERAYYLEGNAGHAGLFSNTADIGVFAQLILNEGSYGGVEYLKPETVAMFTKRMPPLFNRALGFDMKAREGFTTAGTKASENALGHTGFTGTSFWIDPDNRTVIILLTNRTYPYRDHGSGIGRVRADVADVVYNSIIK
jgi:beta-N-acetylhexosaminidase